jgi:hypothetical protein
MNEPAHPGRADLLLMESTYGDREHRGEQDSLAQLREVLQETWRRGGSVMIPSFAVGRTQDILFHLGCLHYQGELDNWEVFLDSPMASHGHRHHPGIRSMAGHAKRGRCTPTQRGAKDFPGKVPPHTEPGDGYRGVHGH